MSVDWPVVVTGPEYGPRTVWENWALLMALAASQGLIQSAVRAVSVEAGPDSIILHVCVEEDSALLREDLADWVSDLGTQIDIVEPRPTISLNVTVGQSGPEWSGYHHRRMFMRSIWTENPPS